MNRDSHYSKMRFVLPNLIEELTLNLIRNNPLDKDKVLLAIFGLFDQSHMPDDEFLENLEKHKIEAAIYVRNYILETVPEWINPPHPNFDHKYEIDLIFYLLFEKDNSYVEGPFRTNQLDEYWEFDNNSYNGNIVLINIFSRWIDNLNDSVPDMYNDVFSKGLDYLRGLEKLEEVELERKYAGSYMDSDFNDTDDYGNDDNIDEEAISWQDLYDYNENH